MKTLIVHIKVTKGSEAAFIAATCENLTHTLKEPGIWRFELLQDEADPSRFALVEGYRTVEAQASHRETAHYLKWKDLIEPMMAEQRTRALYSEIKP
jgi:(4S)-4-hydroxy-5-phosphonooxypentane-2,3-dione isomerase